MFQNGALDMDQGMNSCGTVSEQDELLKCPEIDVFKEDMEIEEWLAKNDLDVNNFSSFS